MRLQTRSRRIIPEFVIPVTPDPVDFRELPGSPKFPGNPLTIRPALRPRQDRVRATGPRVNVLGTAPASKQNEGSSQIANFGAQSHGFWSRYLRLVVMVTHHCTLDSLPAAGPSFAGRDSNPQGFYERSLSITTLPPFPSSVAQASFGAFRAPPAPSVPHHWLLAPGHAPRFQATHSIEHMPFRAPLLAGATRGPLLRPYCQRHGAESRHL